MYDLSAIFNGGAQRLLDKNVVRPRMVDDVHEDLKVTHVRRRYDNHVAEPAV